MNSTSFSSLGLSDKSFLVTGGAGFIGSHIVDFLLRNGAKKVRVLDNLSTGFIENVALFNDWTNYEFLQGDIRDYDTCKEACKGIDCITHQAALGSVPRSVENPMLTTAVNVGGFVNVLKAAQESGIKRVVFASSSSVYGDEQQLPKIETTIGQPLSPYAASKRSKELYAQSFAAVYGMEIIGLRYFNIFGPRQSPKGPYAAVIPLFIEGCLRGTSVYVNGNGLQTRDFTYVQNAVQANVLALTTRNINALNQVYNIAVGQQFSVNTLFEYIAQYLNSSQKPIYREARLGDVLHSLADISKASNLLQYTPEITFYEGLDNTIAYFLANKATLFKE